MDDKRWVRPYEMPRASTVTRDLPDVGRNFLEDDPSAGLAQSAQDQQLRQDRHHSSEFLWAHFLRRRMSRRSVEADFEEAIEKALTFTKSQGFGLSARLYGPRRTKLDARPTARP